MQLGSLAAEISAPTGLSRREASRLRLAGAAKGAAEAEIAGALLVERARLSRTPSDTDNEVAARNQKTVPLGATMGGDAKAQMPIDNAAAAGVGVARQDTAELIRIADRATCSTAFHGCGVWTDALPGGDADRPGHGAVPAI